MRWYEVRRKKSEGMRSGKDYGRKRCEGNEKK
jgi:hypothetical protein